MSSSSRSPSVPTSSRPTRSPRRRPARPTLVQFFLGDPQGYKGPEIRYAGGADGLRADAEAAGVDLYVHAPYIVNVATTNNRIRIPSRKLLQQHMDAAAEIGAKGLIVHGGHVNKDDDPAKGFDNWRKADRGHRHQDPAADREHRRRRQRDGPPPRPDRRGLGRDLGGRGLRAGRLLPRHLPRLGRRHRPGHRRREGPLDHRPDRPGARQRQPRRLRLRRRPARQLRRTASSTPDDFAGVVRDAGAPVVCETPGGAEEHRADFAWLREHGV